MLGFGVIFPLNNTSRAYYSDEDDQGLIIRLIGFSDHLHKRCHRGLQRDRGGGRQGVCARAVVSSCNSDNRSYEWRASQRFQKVSGYSVLSCDS